MKQRQCVILKGEINWSRDTALALLTDFDSSRCVCLSNDAFTSLPTIGIKKAQTVLGREFDAVIIDGSAELNPDSLGAMVGTVVAGGVLIVLLKNEHTHSLWLQRFLAIARQYQQSSPHIHYIEQQQDLPVLSKPDSLVSSAVIANSEQQQAINAVLKVVSGHRRRPLVLTADRGRGKSAALGMAAAELIKQGKQTILVTAPSLACSETVFEYAKRLLADSEYSSGKLSIDTAVVKFVAPDELIQGDYKADLVLVDEAAAIPAALLEKLLDTFSRIVFSSTIHGYEGTGRGFAVRFQKTLDLNTPNWNHYHIQNPVRWRQDDVLEQFSFDVLMLNAEPSQFDADLELSVQETQFECVDRHDLVNDETTLAAVFGLMVLAHYRTRPSDLLMMMDRDDISVYVMRFQGHIVASAWCVEEGGLTSDLADAIYAGERRLKGHLLPQSLLAHAGVADAGALRYQRIIRIAVHPNLQRQGLGQVFISHLMQHLANTTCDVVGVSFAASLDLIAFWQQSQFMPVRLGLHHDEVSGSHALMMLRAVSKQGVSLAESAKFRFQQQWPDLIPRQFKGLDPQLIVTISHLLGSITQVISDTDKQEVVSFASKQRGYEFSEIALCHYLITQVTQSDFVEKLDHQQQALAVMSLLQQRSWHEICQKLNFTGKKQAVIALRQAIRNLLT